MVFTRDTVKLTAEWTNNITKCAVIHIKASFNKNSALVNTKHIALLNMIIKNGTHKVICTCNSVHITGKMKIYILHRDNLRISAACRTAFNSENRAEWWLAKGGNCFFAKPIECLRKADWNSSLTLSRRGWINSRYQNKLAVFFIF